MLSSTRLRNIKSTKINKNDNVSKYYNKNMIKNYLCDLFNHWAIEHEGVHYCIHCKIRIFDWRVENDK